MLKRRCKNFDVRIRGIRIRGRLRKLSLGVKVGKLSEDKLEVAELLDNLEFTYYLVAGGIDAKRGLDLHLLFDGVKNAKKVLSTIEAWNSVVLGMIVYSDEPMGAIVTRGVEMYELAVKTVEKMLTECFLSQINKNLAIKH